MNKILEILPEGQMKISFRWLGAIVLAVATVSIGYANLKTQSAEVLQDRAELHNAVLAIQDLKLDLAALKVSLEDLRRSVDQLSSQHGR
jgi:hypothetical protein